MNLEEEFSIPDICQLIHTIIQVDTKYFTISHTAKEKSTNAQIPIFLENHIEQSLFSIEQILINKEKNDVCYYKDELLQLYYLGKGIWQDLLYKGTIVIGPFLSDSINRNHLEKIMADFSVNDDSLFNLKQYFEGMTILDQNRLESISYLLTNLVPKKILQPNMILSDVNDLNLIQHSLAVNENKYSEIERIYHIEKQILHAVEKGDREEALKFLNLFKIDLTYRIPGNPLRTYKNLGFSLNTSLRITVERTGISPIYLHLLSNKIAILIENLATIAEFENIQTVMISEYCQLVETDRSQKYSPVVKEAITSIQLHYFEKISLSSISKKININNTYLSKRFKIETGQTITHYIQNLRINHSKELIKQNQFSITEIALKVGFENLNYFCTTFKKVTGVTPKHYFKL